MIKAIYTKSKNELGRYACVEFEECIYDYKEINSEEEFQKIKNEIITELKDENTSLIKVSFYNETTVPFELSYDDINETDEYNRIDEVNEMTYDKILNDVSSGMKRWEWEMFNSQVTPPEELIVGDDPSKLDEFYKKNGLLK